MSHTLPRSDSDRARIAAHLILGPRPEPFLATLLTSLEGVVHRIIVNDNAPDPSPHAEVLRESFFAKCGALIIDRTPFTSFDSARNICLKLHAEHDAGEWILLIDADEVHGPEIARIVGNLNKVPPKYNCIDAYTWHFFGSFDWYLSIARRMMIVRYTPNLYWERPVHEQLRGILGARLALPYIYAHYGHTLDARRHAEKHLHYRDLGAGDDTIDADVLEHFEVERYYATYFPQLLHFRGQHPPAARSIVAELRAQLAPFHALVDGIARRQSLPIRAKNTLRSFNYAQRWRLRIVHPLAGRLLR
uniref:Glycosyltransferase 2-like domain-containing protein n=1 Tax=mine drainage metagenome TaxID=410659 RepID=E6Q2Q7_9ZZZZ